MLLACLGLAVCTFDIQLESQHHQRSPWLEKYHNNDSFEHAADVDLEYILQEEVMAFRPSCEP